MSDQQQDERLIELMTEFLQTSNKDADHSIVRKAHPELDNEETQNLIKSLTAEVELFKSQLQDVRKKVLSQSQKETYSGDGLEINAVQNSIADQTTKIGDLEYKIQILKTDLENRKENKPKSSFGMLGWGMLASNILLWSALGWFIWQHYNGGFANGLTQSAVVQEEATTTKKNIINNAEATVMADKSVAGKPRGLPVAADATTNQSGSGNNQNAQNVGVQNSTAQNTSVGTANVQSARNTSNTVAAQKQVEAKKTEQVTSSNRASIKKVVASAPAKKIEQTAVKTANPVIAKKATSKKQIKTVAKKTVRPAASKKVVETKRAIAQKKSVAKKAKAIASQAKKTARKAVYVEPKTSQPQVRFGD